MMLEIFVLFVLMSVVRCCMLVCVLFMGSVGVVRVLCIGLGVC